MRVPTRDIQRVACHATHRLAVLQPHTERESTLLPRAPEVASSMAETRS